MVMAPPPMCDSAVSPCFHGCPGFFHRHFPPQSPPSHPLHPSSAVNSSPRPGFAPQSLPSSSQPLRCLWYVCGKDCLILIPFRLPQVSYFPFSLKCFSTDSDNCPDVGVRPLLQVPHLRRAGPGLWTLPFPNLVPSSYWVFHGSVYSFPLVRYSRPLSAHILHALLCLRMYSWCISGERLYSMPTYSSTIFNRCFLTGILKKYNILTLVVRRTGCEKWGRLFSVLCRRDLMV